MSQLGRLERVLDDATAVARPLLKAGPVLLVASFFEDGLRMIYSYTEQMSFLSERIGSVPTFLWIVLSVVVQLGGASCLLLVLRRGMPITVKHNARAFRLGIKEISYALLAFTVVQPFVYGHAQAYDVNFVCRALTLAGGFFLLI